MTDTQYNINVTSKLIESLSLRDNPIELSIINSLYEKSLIVANCRTSDTYLIQYTVKLSNERPTYSLKLFITRLTKPRSADLPFKIANSCELIINLKCATVYKTGAIFDILNTLPFSMEFMTQYHLLTMVTIRHFL